MLVWSKELPTVPGYYWFRETRYSQPRLVDFILLGLTEFIPCQQSIRDRNRLETQYNPTGEWAGPILEPLEPKEKVDEPLPVPTT